MPAHSGRSRADARPTRRALLSALLLTAAFAAVELAGGWLSGSLALLSDAGHMLADVFAIVLALFAVQLAQRRATAEKTYGYYRLEILSALFNGVLLCLVALLLLREAWERFFHPQPVLSSLMLAVAALGLLANLVSAAILARSAHNLSVRAAYLHVLGDTLSSVGVLVGGLAILATGETRIDPAVGGVIAAVILWSAQRLVREAVDVLLEAIPKGIHALDVNRLILETRGVVAVHDLHIWSLTTGLEALSAHVHVRREDLPETDRILGEINAALLDRFRIRHTTIQVESDAVVHDCAVDE